MNTKTASTVKALEDAIAIVGGPTKGGKTKLARAIGVSPTYITLLLSGEREMTLDRAIEVEKLTLGRVRIERLCPSERTMIEYLSRRGAMLPAL